MPTKVDPISATTQEFLEIEDIQNDLVMLVDGSCALIIETSAVNFGLLSEKEQEALIFAYSGLLNSLSFPIQIYIRSTRKDVGAYLHQLERAENQQKNPTQAARIKSYREFIANTVKERNVLDKKFYVVIPFSSLELGLANVKAFTKQKGLPDSKESIFKRAKMVLTPKRDHLVRQLSRLGLKGNHLTTSRLIELFHNVYNPDAVTSPVDVAGYTVPIVNKRPW